MSRALTVMWALFLALAAGTLCHFSSPSGRAADDAPKPGDPGKDPKGLGGRTGAGKARLLKEFGGSEASEEAVMLGLAWLTQLQKSNGSWSFAYDGTEPNVVILNQVKQPEPVTQWSSREQEVAAATGLALLSFLGAGQSHKAGRYQQTVQAGLDFLVKDQLSEGALVGSFRSVGIGAAYDHGIAALALCEAYGLTRDKALLPAVQAAVNYIQQAQAANGSWGYTFRTPGDTSIVGWMIQALHAVSFNQDVKVDQRVLDKAIAFLNGNSKGPGSSIYGYRDLITVPQFVGPSTSLTAIGLLLRYYINGWRSDNLGFAQGVKGLMARAPDMQERPDFDMYFYYYATQVVRFYGKDEWSTWNEGPMAADGSRKGGMQDWLISLQDRGATNRGSWPPDVGVMGPCTGRLGTTALCLLTLEVYYRYSPENANQK